MGGSKEAEEEVESGRNADRSRVGQLTSAFRVYLRRPSATKRTPTPHTLTPAV